MYYAIIELKSETASFRNPEFQNYHKTYLLPPPSTIIGIIGAAKGFSPKAAQDWLLENEIQMGCYGKSRGIAKDLWKYNDFKNGSIVSRDILYKYHIVFVIGSNSKAFVSEIVHAFDYPEYALTLGNSDALAKVISTGITEETILGNELSHCLVDGDVVKDVLDNSDNNLDFSIYHTSEPITYDMPVAFDYKESDYGSRSVISRKVISTISQSMKLNIDKKGIKFKELFIPVFNL